MKDCPGLKRDSLPLIVTLTELVSKLKTCKENTTMINKREHFKTQRGQRGRDDIKNTTTREIRGRSLLTVVVL